MVLDRIKKENDIKDLTREERTELAKEIREFLIEQISNTGGHLASNLGAVELTIALHLVMDFPEDKLIFDVGHQCYTHKILTGRKDDFDSLRKLNGLSGFPKRAESACDSFDTGHSSNSISAALGYAHARDMAGKTNKVVAVIGDGSFTGGEAYEALNNASELKSNLMIVLNDNEMSISENVGGMSTQLTKLRTSTGYANLKDDILASLEKSGKKKTIASIRQAKSSIKQLVVKGGMMFEDMDVMYLGPVDGHDVDAMISMFRQAFNHRGPVVVHVVTKKGNGYEPAEKHPARFHGTAPFEIETGIPSDSTVAGYTDVFSTIMRKMGDREKNVVAITAAMADGTGLKRFRNMFPSRFFDVGIAEQHAVTFAAGLALGGYTPVVAIYSSFLQRAYDQVVEDVCLQNLHVIFAIDRAGIVGGDGATHHGVFDLSYLSMIPNMTVMAPKNKWELSDMMKFAVKFNGPIAIRYPRGEASCDFEDNRDKIVLGKSEMLKSSGRKSKILLLAVGAMVKTADEVFEIVTKDEKLGADLVNARFVKPIDKQFLDKHMDEYKLIVTFEDNVKAGGFGEHVNSYVYANGYTGKVINVAIPDEFVPHGDVGTLKKQLGMDAKSVVSKIKKMLKDSPKKEVSKKETSK